MSTAEQIKNVFLVDDDMVFNMIHLKTIQKEGYAKNVESFINGAIAIDRLQQVLINDPSGFPDIIFLDINMPEMDGWEFLDEYALFPSDITTRCKIYMLSSSIDPKDIERSRTYSTVYEFISKPLTMGKMHSIFARGAG